MENRRPVDQLLPDFNPSLRFVKGSLRIFSIFLSFSRRALGARVFLASTKTRTRKGDGWRGWAFFAKFDGERRGETVFVGNFFRKKSRSFAESGVSALLKRCKIFTIRNKREVPSRRRRRLRAASVRLDFLGLLRRLVFRRFVGRASAATKRTNGRATATADLRAFRPNLLYNVKNARKIEKRSGRRSRRPFDVRDAYANGK